ncbi:MAG TPA: zinc ribbon domain-containing protein [Terriglobales bacterium]|nr:zinc ribbon domain-containing protein [Terriglobales bacterium]
MFCEGCGAPLQAGQKFCPSCGRQLGMAIVTPVAPGRVERHLNLLAILWMAAAAVHLLGAGMLYVLGHTLMMRVGQMAGPPVGPEFFLGLFTVLAVYLLLKAIASFMAGWGLLQKQPWARTLTLVLGFLELLHVPLGTALGIYTLWVLLAPNAGQEYRELQRAHAA